MAPLPPDLRKSLDKSVVKARDKAEEACRAALNALGVDAREAPAALSAEDRQLRNALRAKQRQLGDEFEQLVTECAYEQWHLMLFARFLAENDLLMHQSGAHITLDEVAELAREEGEGDPWLLAARYAAAMLPGIFKPADPCVRLALAPEGRKALEDTLSALPTDVFTAADALGWVYQFWQTKRKKEVNASERKIGGADLAPVTQLFTEHYMVRFLLENSLGAWWAARHPESPLLAFFEYLRFADDGEPAAGRFEGWPASAAEVTVMDLCCGSGHFLVAAFDMLRKMREEEEGLSVRDAVDAVLRDNLFGLELDARCVQLAAFALALAAWKAAGYHELPALNLACSGIPTRGSLEEWTKLAKGDDRLERALARLHELFREADTLGSLIDPRRAVEDDTLMSVPFEEVAPLLERALASDPDPVAAVFGESAREVAKAASLLAGFYTLVATNPPFLGLERQAEALERHVKAHYPAPQRELALCIFERSGQLLAQCGTEAFVLPGEWTFVRSHRAFRRHLLDTTQVNLLARLGPNAFGSSIRATPILFLSSKRAATEAAPTLCLDVTSATFADKARRLAGDDPMVVSQEAWRVQKDSRLLATAPGVGSRDDVELGSVAACRNGLSAGDGARFERDFWEVADLGETWDFLQSSPARTAEFSGRERIVLWENEDGQMAALADSVKHLNHAAQNWRRGKPLWRRKGVAVSQIGARTTIYTGDKYDGSCFAIVPNDETDAAAVIAFALAGNLKSCLQAINPTWNLKSPKTLLQLPLDLAVWRRAASEMYPDGLPEPHSDDPTQWLFKGNVVGSEQPLDVGLARLLGYRWPEQESDELDGLADEDGIVCLPPVAGERPAHERLRELLVAAYGEDFSHQTLDDLLAPEGNKTLEDWLRDKAFASHAKLFHNRPFIWHISDGCKDGFAALVNYHKLDEQTLQKLTYTYLGWWVHRQDSDVTAELAGAETRLAAATELQKKLKLILEGEPPYDIYVRWKPLADQPLGWQPDVNDGVRLNIRPFVTVGVLCAKLSSIHWKKDRGTNPDGSERLNDLHTTLAEKRTAREERRTGE